MYLCKASNSLMWGSGVGIRNWGRGGPQKRALFPKIGHFFTKRSTFSQKGALFPWNRHFFPKRASFCSFEGRSKGRAASGAREVFPPLKRLIPTPANKLNCSYHNTLVMSLKGTQMFLQLFSWIWERKLKLRKTAVSTFWTTVSTYNSKHSVKNTPP